MPPTARAAPHTHVEWVIIVTGSPDLPLDFNNEHSWQAVKDFIRSILASEPDPYEHGSDLWGQANAVQRGSQRLILCTFRDKSAAEKVLDRVGGNDWYGARLAAFLLEAYAGNHMGFVCDKISSSNPVSLDTIYRIRSTNLIHPISQPLPVTLPPVRTNTRENTSLISTYGSMSSQSGIHVPSSQYILPTQAMYSHILEYWNSYLQVNAQQQDQPQPILSLYPSGWSHQSIPSQVQLSPNQLFPPMVYPVDPYTVPSLQQAFSPTFYPQNPQANTNLNPTYHENPNGMLVNIRHGSFPVQSKGIHIRNLNHDANPKDVEEYFQPAGEIRDCQVRSSKRSKQCTAVVSFHSEKEAQLAVQKFNGTKFMGRQIEVKLDQEDGTPESSRSRSDTRKHSLEEPTSPSRGPIIANGDSVPESSQSSRSSRKK